LQRREIEHGLRDGSVRGVVSTNALELGIDIGHLDAAVLCGYPGTIASTWQQIGRAGRRRGAAAAVYVASSSPLDQYLVNHPEYFLGRDPEQGLIDPDNLLILSAHLQAATFELPLPTGEPLRKAPSTTSTGWIGRRRRRTSGRSRSTTTPMPTWPSASKSWSRSPAAQRPI